MRQTLIASSILLAGLAAAASAQTLMDRAKPFVDAALAANQSFAVVSAASGTPALAPGSLATAFGPNLATGTTTGKPPYPTALGGIGVQVVDSAGQAKSAQILYVSASQVNFLIPASSAIGTATVNITNGSGTPLSSTAQIQTVAPSLFTANANGQGVVAATAVRKVLSTNLSGPVQVFQCPGGAGNCVSVPIDPGVDAPVTITLYGTGSKGRSGDAGVTVKIGGMTVTPTAVGSIDPTDLLAGIDQISFVLPLALHGSGEVDIAIIVDGVTSNTGKISVA